MARWSEIYLQMQDSFIDSLTGIINHALDRDLPAGDFEPASFIGVVCP